MIMWVTKVLNQSPTSPTCHQHKLTPIFVINIDITTFWSVRELIINHYKNWNRKTAFSYLRCHGLICICCLCTANWARYLCSILTGYIMKNVPEFKNYLNFRRTQDLIWKVCSPFDRVIISRNKLKCFINIINVSHEKFILCIRILRDLISLIEQIARKFTWFSYMDPLTVEIYLYRSVKTRHGGSRKAVTFA